MTNIKISPWPSYTNEEANAVSRVLLSNKVNYWTGTECRDFELEFADWVGVSYSVALANGTLALESAIRSMDLSADADIIVTPRTFLASASAIVACGANPIFADVDMHSQNITADTIKAALTPKTEAVIVVHLAGMPAEMDEIMALSKVHDFYVIEDCAQAHGAMYKNRSVGSIGHVGSWSFCQDKIMSTGGEGGMVTTNSEALWSKMWSYKDHGKGYDAVYNRDHPEGFRWLHESFGSNFRMTEMQAAIGRLQLQKIAGWTEIRQSHAKKLDAVLSRFSCVLVKSIPSYIQHARYKYYTFIKPEKLNSGWNRDQIVKELNNLGVPCFQGSCSEIYMEKAFENTKWKPSERLTNARLLGEISLSFLVHPTISKAEIENICNIIEDVLSRASK